MNEIMKINLQLFEDVMNKTTSTGLTAGMKTFWNTALLQNSRAQMYFLQFAKTQVLPENHGETVEWRKWNTLPNASKLTEGVAPEGKAIGQSVLTDSIDQYGLVVKITDRLDLHHVDDVMGGAEEELSASAAKTQDELVRNDLMVGTNVIYAGGKTSRASLTKTDILTPQLVARAATNLKKMNAPTINGKYVAIIHPSVAYDLRQSEGWIEAHKYAAVTELFNGEIGELHGVRFVETTQAPIVQAGSGTVAYATIFLGKDAYGTIEPTGAGLQMIIKTKEEAGGPLNQFATAGYKLETNGAKILYEERMVRVESGSEYSDVDKTN